jgi:TubC N-terminal docking domain
MSIESLLAGLVERGIRLIPDGDRLVVEPASKLSDDDRRAIRAHKAALLTLLSQPKIDNDSVGPAWVASSARGRDVFDDEPGHERPGVHRDSIALEVRQELERIWPEAERLGWPQQRIWGASFWPAADRGLAAVLDPKDRVVEVTNDFVTIVKRDGTRAHFMRCNG